MDGSALIGFVLSAVSFGTLARSALYHLSSRTRFIAIAESQAVLPPRLLPFVFVMLVAVESFLGLGGTAALLAADLTGLQALLTITLLGSATLFAVFSVYSTLAMRSSPGVPCGCSSSEDPLTPLVPFRAIALCLASLSAAYLVRDFRVTSVLDLMVTIAIAGIFIAVTRTLSSLLRPTTRPYFGDASA